MRIENSILLSVNEEDIKDGTFVIPQGVTSIGSWAFDCCASLASLTLPQSLTSIGDRAFNGCASLTAVTLPQGITRIGDGAFDCCPCAEEIKIRRLPQ